MQNAAQSGLTSAQDNSSWEDFLVYEDLEREGKLTLRITEWLPFGAPVTTLEKIPPNTIIVKGAEPSASDRSTPVPENGAVSRNIYNNRYLGITLPMPSDWTGRWI